MMMETRSRAAARPAPPIHVTPSPTPMLRRACACGGSHGSAGECEECGQKHRALRRQARQPESGGFGKVGVPSIVHDVLRSPGQPLGVEARAFMEARLGHDFSQVRVHTDARAADSARAVNAKAYTVGRNVVFAAGQYAPEAAEGKRLLAHELVHVMQQSSAASPDSPASDSARNRPMGIGDPFDPSELEADGIAGGIGHGPGAGTMSYRESTELLECIRIMGQENADYCREAAHDPANWAVGRLPPVVCAPGTGSTRMSATIQPVQVARDDGSNPTALPSFARLDIWNRCCVDFTVAAPVTINSTAMQIVDDTGGLPTAEELALAAAAPGGTQINVVMVSNFDTGGGALDPDSGGGALTHPGTGAAHETVIAVEGTVSEVIAHEVGHAIGASHACPNLIMCGTGHHNVPNPLHVNAAVCTAARTGAALTPSATTCCLNLT
jgi:hypothetical protein